MKRKLFENRFLFYTITFLYALIFGYKSYWLAIRQVHLMEKELKKPYNRVERKIDRFLWELERRTNVRM